MKKSLFFGLMLMIALSLSAQQQMYVWLFGEKVVFELADVDSITFGEPLPPSDYADVYIIEIDSAVTCCGIDSFTIKFFIIFSSLGLHLISKMQSSCIFILFIISNLVFAFTAIKIAPYIIVNGMLGLIYATIVYKIIKTGE